MSFPAREMELLSSRILSGEVVFFVGAGFSLDSEGNSAKRLIRRLLIRFAAMTQHLSQASFAGVKDAEAIRHRASELQQSLRGTFELSATGDLLTEENLKKLADSYYTFNDWICSAFTEMLGDCEQVAGKGGRALPRLQSAIQAIEEKLLRPGGGRPDLDPVDLDTPRLREILQLRGIDRGKALFLDTMGFANREIMAGPALDEPLDMNRRLWEGKVLDRHQVLARLAREGLCPTILTTNYDLLLEWAFRLAGLLPSGVQDPRQRLPPTTFQNLVRISEATDFFGRGSAFRSALIAKIHGCSDVYRHRKGTPKDWQAYLRSLVFTFREIQNWREDDWSRDFLRTLLRTRTLVFCGYSGMDPVLHDTFRTVYEEMALRRRDGVPTAAKPAGELRKDRERARRAPAYFLGLAGRVEFYGMEILRSATRAMGEGNPALTRHPNYLRFYLGDDPEERFPSLDELMRWLFHLVFRRCQHMAIDSDLRRIAALLLKHPCREKDIETARRRFLRLFRWEIRMARGWDENAPCRRQLDRIAGWTDRFQAGLLRELALAEAVLRNQWPGVDFEHLRGCPWYFPALERTDWTAWAAMVEIAARRMIAAWRGAGRKWMADSDWVRPGSGPHPAILFSQGSGRPTPGEVSIRVAPAGRPGSAGAHGALRHRAVWTVDPQSLPWCVDQALPQTPTAGDIWRWAVEDVDVEKERENLERWLGASDERQRASAA